MTDLIEVKTSDLAGEALAWAVAKADGLEPRLEAPHYGNGWRVFRPSLFPASGSRSERYDPHKNWALSGPLIRKNGISLHSPQHPDDCWAAWAKIDGKEIVMPGDTEIIAACRVVVAAKLGSLIQVPKELMP